MKAVQYTEHGGPEVLRVVEAPDPVAGPGRVRIQVRAAGVNGIDWKLRTGMGPSAKALEGPTGTGTDAAGVVDQVGEGVTGTQVGDAIFGFGSGTYAELAVLSEWARKPEALSFEEAAGFPIPAETAIRILRVLDLKTGQRLLVSGAAGGVGSALTQIARQRGLVVIGTASERNQTYVRSLGALPTTYGEGLVERVRALAPEGIDAAADVAGSGVIPELIELTGDPSKVVSIADFQAQKYGAQVTTGGGDRGDALEEAARLAEQGALHLPVARTFSLEEAADAQRASAEGHVAGRFIVVP